MALSKILIGDSGNTAKSKLDSAFNIIDDIVLNGVTLTGSQTLTNKTLTSPILTTPQLNDASADHQYIFAVSELAADRTVTWPLLISNDTLVLESHIQTLVNKTLTSPVINSPTGIVKGDVGLGNLDNTSDINKPVSTAQQAALDLKQNSNSLNTLYDNYFPSAGPDTVGSVNDINKFYHTTNVGATQLILNGGGSTFPIGGVISVYNDTASAGNVAFTAGGGVTMVNIGGANVAADRIGFAKRVGVNKWVTWLG